MKKSVSTIRLKIRSGCPLFSGAKFMWYHIRRMSCSAKLCGFASGMNHRIKMPLQAFLLIIIKNSKLFLWGWYILEISGNDGNRN